MILVRVAAALVDIELSSTTIALGQGQVRILSGCVCAMQVVRRVSRGLHHLLALTRASVG